MTTVVHRCRPADALMAPVGGSVHAHRGTGPMTMLPCEPIVEVVSARGGIGAVLGMQPAGVVEPRRSRFTDAECDRWSRAYYRIARRGCVTPELADRFCLEVLDVNPALVYGDVWWDDVDEPDEIAEAWAAGMLPLVLDGAA